MTLYGCPFTGIASSGKTIKNNVGVLAIYVLRTLVGCVPSFITLFFKHTFTGAYSRWLLPTQIQFARNKVDMRTVTRADDNDRHYYVFIVRQLI